MKFKSEALNFVLKEIISYNDPKSLFLLVSYFREVNMTKMGRNDILLFFKIFL